MLAVCCKPLHRCTNFAFRLHWIALGLDDLLMMMFHLCHHYPQLAETMMNGFIASLPQCPTKETHPHSRQETGSLVQQLLLVAAPRDLVGKPTIVAEDTDYSGLGGCKHFKKSHGHPELPGQQIQHQTIPTQTTCS